MNYFKYIFVFFIIFNSDLYAATFVCPNTYQTVATGYTTEQVRSACGNPTNTTTQSGIVNVPVTYEQWVYTLASPTGQSNAPSDKQQEAQLTITFNNNGVVESINTKNASTIIGMPCHDFNQLQVGASKNDVQMQCGSPTSINTIQRVINQQQNITIWTYNYGQYRPQMIFTFQDDKLTEIRTGQLGSQ
jgi:outer membrane protein assembly factor BamE (lipoprotein component of BamABCDE complex)